ncbi:MAG TPA: class I SAM-dependent methyltransferase [Chitinophagaceae bacterium]
MMDVKEAYNEWADQYDTNDNKTRDTEAKAKKEILNEINFERCLEIGCGTGKNTEWLSQKAMHITAVDLSEEMLAKAKQKIKSDHVTFVQADIRENWDFAKDKYNLVTFSLVLEHIDQIEPIIQKAADALADNGYLYIGELHPFKQYSGSKARFTSEDGEKVVACYNHHISDFTEAARKAGLKAELIKEYFDMDDRNSLPRIICFLFKKDASR